MAGLIKRLESSVAAFEDTGRRLPHAITSAVEARMESSAQQGAATIATNLTGATAYAQRAADIATLEETVRQLERKGGRARLARCPDLKKRERLCVQVDDSVQYENGYRIIKGY